MNELAFVWDNIILLVEQLIKLAELGWAEKSGEVAENPYVPTFDEAATLEAIESATKAEAREIIKHGKWIIITTSESWPLINSGDLPDEIDLSTYQARVVGLLYEYEPMRWKLAVIARSEVFPVTLGELLDVPLGQEG